MGIAAHMIKGGASYIGAHQLTELCKEAQFFQGTEQELAEFFKEIIREYAVVEIAAKTDQSSALIIAFIDVAGVMEGTDGAPPERQTAVPKRKIRNAQGAWTPLLL